MMIEVDGITLGFIFRIQFRLKPTLIISIIHEFEILIFGFCCESIIPPFPETPLGGRVTPDKPGYEFSKHFYLP